MPIRPPAALRTLPVRGAASTKSTPTDKPPLAANRCNSRTLIEFRHPGLRSSGDRMSDKSEEQLREVEATQQELKQSIERSRELVDRARRQLEQLKHGTTEH